jgi:hypothetical protein
MLLLPLIVLSMSLLDWSSVLQLLLSISASKSHAIKWHQDIPVIQIQIDLSSRPTCPPWLVDHPILVGILTEARFCWLRQSTFPTNAFGERCQAPIASQETTTSLPVDGAQNGTRADLDTSYRTDTSPLSPTNNMGPCG